MTHIVRLAFTLIPLIVIGALLGACAPLATQTVSTSQACAPTAPCPACPACPVPAKPVAPKETRYERTSFDALDGWNENKLAPSLAAFMLGCDRLVRRELWRDLCVRASSVTAGDESAARAFFEQGFEPWQVIDGEGNTEGLFTGYYEPILRGQSEANTTFRYPVFGVPDDLVVVDLAELYPELRHLRLRGRLEGRRLVPYRDRGQIDATGAQLPAPILGWVADPVELFFLQIQGSGQLELPDGSRTRLGYADQNGHPYRSMGRWLADRGEMTLAQTSMQGIKAWAANNPNKLQDALNANPSYVFFRELPPTDGPPGAMGVPLTGGYSLAIDPRHIPLGAPLYLSTTAPSSTQALQRLMMGQDTGGAIRGAVRGDFFWGLGEAAGREAGRMRQRGRYWLLWPRGAVPQRPQ